MYRCYVCDTPPDMGHQQECLMTDRSEQEQQPEPQRLINIASGEDVVLEEAA